MHLAPIAGWGTATGGTGFALPAPLLTIVSCLEPGALLPDLIQGLVDSPLCSSVSMSFIPLRGRISWAIFDPPSKHYQWRSGMPFLTARDFRWPSSFRTWGCGRRRLSILGAVRSLFPAEWAVCLGNVVVPYLKRMGPSRLWLELPPTSDTSYHVYGVLL
jgi:hypothetical protein